MIDTARHTQPRLRQHAANLKSAQPFRLDVEAQHVPTVHDPVTIGIEVEVRFALVGMCLGRQADFAPQTAREEPPFIKSLDHIRGQNVVILVIAQGFVVDIGQAQEFIPARAADLDLTVEPITREIVVIGQIGVIGHGLDIELQPEIAVEVETPGGKYKAPAVIGLQIVLRNCALDLNTSAPERLAVTKFEGTGVVGQVRSQRQVAPVVQANEIGRLDTRAEPRVQTNFRQQKAGCAILRRIRQAQTWQIEDGHGRHAPARDGDGFRL